MIFKCYSSEELITLNTLHEVVPTWYSFHSWVDWSNADKVSCSRRKHIDAEVRTRDLCIQNRHSNHYANCSEPLVYLKETYPPAHKAWNPLPTKYLFAPNLYMLVKSGTRIQWNALRKLIKFKEIHLYEYRRDTDTSLLVKWLNLDSLYTCWLIQQASMFKKFHYNLIDICPPSYMHHANHISSRTDHPWSIATRTPYRLMSMKKFPSLYEYLELSPLHSCFSCDPLCR